VAERLEVHLPDIGDFHDVAVVELLVAVGQRVEKEQSLLVIESDKATMEIPAPAAGVIDELRVAIGDTVNEGDLIAVIRSEAAAPKPEPAAAVERRSPPGAEAAPAADLEEVEAPAAAARPPLAHATPSVRRLARELGVELARVPGTARKGRITREDVQKFVKASLSQGSASGVTLAGVAVAAPLDIDFSKWGATELQPLNRVRRISSSNLHRSWVTVPHVTQFDEADITELDAFRAAQKDEAQRRGVKLTFLPFVVKAVTAALREFPHFNSSLDRSGESLILKKYFHIGVAVDTENGLLVPVIRDADQKGLFELAAALEDLSTRARSRRLRPADLSGGSFSISSLGGIGGTFFTPIVNHPEVAILGVSRMQWKPVWQGKDFAPRLLLPLSLSYDHRVIDGADAVRFTRRLAELVGDLRRLLL
jgi:pyruvate dehydrogenase E2 component (dihydrolipoamide acetyltransferase)